MGKIISTLIDRFDGGMVNDPRDTQEATCRVCTNFDIFTNPRKLTPYRQSEDGNSGASTNQQQNFAVALRTGTTYSLYALGVQTAQPARAEILYKDISTGGSNDLDDAGWSTPSNNQSSAGSTSFNLFFYYKLAGLIIGARAGTNLWAFSPTGSSWQDSWQTLSYTNIAQGLVHSKDDISYIPYDNKIATYNHSGTAWNATALTLPSHLYITSICEDGNYLVIAAAPLSGIGSSWVFWWDRDATLTTISESADCGEGVIKILEKVDGVLLGVSISGGNSTRFKNKVIFKSISSAGAVEMKTLQDTTTTSILPIVKQKIDNRLYFLMSITLNGAIREGVWSFGRSSASQPFSLVHERTPNNATLTTNGVMKGFYILGDYAFVSYVDNGAFVLSKTNDQEAYTTSSAIYESKIFNLGDSSIVKKLIGATVMTEFLPSGASYILKYRVDQNTSWTTIFTNSTQNSISGSAVKDASGANLTEFKEIQFQVLSTGAVITGLSFMSEVIDKRTY